VPECTKNKVQMLNSQEYQNNFKHRNVDREGREKVLDFCGDNFALGLKAEVMDLRDLTRETCALLATLAYLGANKSLPST